MNVRHISGNGDLSPTVVAAVIAAVEEFLQDEAASVSRAIAGFSSWRMASREVGRGFGANVSWRGRD